jgi:ankyrin repeat protein
MEFSMTSHNSPTESSFFEAISNGDMATVQELLMHGMDVNHLLVVEGTRDTIPLVTAVEANNIAIIKLLLEHGADINKKACSRPALSHAVARGNAETVRLLLEHGADVNELWENGLTGAPGTDTALCYAVLRGNAEIVRLLLEHGADVNSYGDHGADLLVVADMAVNMYQLPHYDPEVETLLREYGAWIDDTIGHPYYALE